MKAKYFLILSILLFTLTVPLLGNPVFADGGSPYGGHTPTDTGVESLNQLSVFGLLTITGGTSLLSLSSFITSKFA